MAAPSLLNLPKELLVNICDSINQDQEWFSRHSDLSNVRLTCKRLDNAAFDLWCDRLIACRNCDVGDMEVLQNTRSILATEHLARKMRSASIVVNDDEGMTGYNINLPLLQSVLQDFKRASVQLLVSMPLQENNPDLVSALSHCILSAILASGCKVDMITMDDYPPIQPELLETPESAPFSDLSKHLTVLEYNADLTIRCTDIDEACHFRRAPLRLFADAHKLDFLALGTWKTNSSNARLEAAVTFRVLLANSYSCLRHFSLHEMDCHLSDVRTVLERAQDTLQELRLHKMHLYSNGREWGTILSALQQCKQLRDLSLGYLLEDTNYNEHIDFTHRVNIHDARSGIVHPTWDPDSHEWKNASDIQASLALNIEKWSE